MRGKRQVVRGMGYGATGNEGRDVEGHGVRRAEGVRRASHAMRASGVGGVSTVRGSAV